MKIVNKIKYLLPALFLAAGCLCTSCTDDEVAGGGKGFKGEGLNLSVSVEPLSEKVMAREASSRTDRSRIERLDVVLANGDDITKVIHINNNSAPLSASYTATQTGLVEQSLPLDNPASLNLHIGTDDIQGANRVYIVANYIDEKSGVVTPLPITETNTVSNLKALKQGYPTTAAARMVCTMFGELEVQGEAHGSHTSKEISLTRTLSMITLAIDGTNLYPGIVIIPQSAQLVNVPTSCTITGDNTPSEASGISSVGQLLSDLQNRWGAVANKSTGNSGDYQQIVPFSTVDQCHGIADEVIPLFMFENKQGISSSTEEKSKTPPTGKESFCSYIEVKATYRYSTTLNGTQPSIDDFAGNIIYRFYLGENITNDFNVTRNKHYMLTLHLKNWGGLIEDGVITDGVYNPNDGGSDVSWRVDYTHLGSGVLDDVLEVPAGGSRVDITLVGDYDKVGNDVHLGYKITGMSNTVWVKESKTEVWDNNPSTAKIPDLIYSNGDGTFTLKIYVKPIGETEFNQLAGIGEYENNATNPSGQKLDSYAKWIQYGYRDHVFTIEGDKGEHQSLNDEFTIRQWLPMPVMVDDNGNEITTGDPRDAELYFSRFDIYHGKPLPWCDAVYNGVDLKPGGGNLVTDAAKLGILDGNGNPGLTFNPDYGFHNVVAYFVTAKENEFKGLDFKDGMPESITEYAIFESANAEPAEGGMFHDTPETVTTMDHYGLASVAEWIKIEKYGIIDPRYPLIPGTLYWTSTIPPNDVGKNLVYQYGAGEAGVEIRDRSMTYTGRMVYHKNDKAQFGTTP